MEAASLPVDQHSCAVRAGCWAATGIHRDTTQKGAGNDRETTNPTKIKLPKFSHSGVGAGGASSFPKVLICQKFGQRSFDIF